VPQQPFTFPSHKYFF